MARLLFSAFFRHASEYPSLDMAGDVFDEKVSVADTVALFKIMKGDKEGVDVLVRFLDLAPLANQSRSIQSVDIRKVFAHETRGITEMKLSLLDQERVVEDTRIAVAPLLIKTFIVEIEK